MSRPLRILHLVQNLNYGGMERLIGDLVRLADPARTESHVLALQYVGRFGALVEGNAVIHRAGRMEPWSLLHPGALAAQIRAIAPDVVHTHSGVWWKGALAARMAAVPHLVHTEHGRRAPDPLDDRWIDGRAARHCDRVVAVSEPLARHLRDRVLSRGARPPVVIINGVDTRAFLPGGDGAPLRRELGIAEGVPVLGSVGRLEPIKGYEVAIRALALLRGVEPAPVLVVAGDGSERARLLALAGRLGVADRVFLPGWRDDLPALHGAFSLFTMSSHSEGTSVSLLEAMSAGLCPVVTRVGGNAHVLGDRLAHRLVAPGDPAALAAAWRSALASPARLGQDAREARQRVAASFSAEAMVRSYEALYAGLQAEGRAA